MRRMGVNMTVLWGQNQYRLAGSFNRASSRAKQGRTSCPSKPAGQPGTRLQVSAAAARGRYRSSVRPSVHSSSGYIKRVLYKSITACEKNVFKK